MSTRGCCWEGSSTGTSPSRWLSERVAAPSTCLSRALSVESPRSRRPNSARAPLSKRASGNFTFEAGNRSGRLSVLDGDPRAEDTMGRFTHLTVASEKFVCLSAVGHVFLAKEDFERELQ